MGLLFLGKGKLCGGSESTNEYAFGLTLVLLSIWLALKWLGEGEVVSLWSIEGEALRNNSTDGFVKKDELCSDKWNLDIEENFLCS